MTFMPGPAKGSESNLIDFAQHSTSRFLSYSDYIRWGDLTICDCTYAPNHGTVLGSAKLVITFHTNAPYKLIWRNGQTSASVDVRPGTLHICPADAPLYLHWGDAQPRVKTIAFQPEAVHRTLVSAGINPPADLQYTLGARDNVLWRLAGACHEAIAKHGIGSRLFADGVTLAFISHIYTTYFHGKRTTNVRKGGLSPRNLRRTLSYIEEHLHEDMGLEDLAAVVDLSTNYFIEAFRKSVGTTPYHYVLRERIQRAKELLIKGDLPVADIVGEVGFSSQPQFITTFRKFTGITPGRFRRQAM
jgi:AraC family transcriptional regulator